MKAIDKALLLALLVSVSSARNEVWGRPLPLEPGVQAVKACSLLPKEEVKRLLPWNNRLDQFPPEEEPLGASGSGCEYPSVRVQVLPYSAQTIEAARKRGKLENVAGVGDEAYLWENPQGYLELYAKVGMRLLTLQANVGPGQTQATVKPGAVSLAKALTPKLR